MAFFTIEVDYSQIEDFGVAMQLAPHRLLRETTKAFKHMGASDIARLKREQLSGGAGHLNIRSKGLSRAFKFKAPDKVEQFDQLYVSEYTGWKAFKIFETGGTIRPSRKRLLTVLTDNARTGGGKRKYTQKQLVSMVKNGELRLVKTRNVILIVKNVGGRTKTGAFRKNSRNDVIAILVPRVRVPKLLSFFENFQKGAAEHDRILGEAVGRTLGDIAADKDTGGGQ